MNIGIADAHLNHRLRDVTGERPNTVINIPTSSTTMRSIATSDRRRACCPVTAYRDSFVLDWLTQVAVGFLGRERDSQRSGWRSPIDRSDGFSGFILPCDTEKSLHCPRLSWRVSRCSFAVVFIISQKEKEIERWENGREREREKIATWILKTARSF